MAVGPSVAGTPKRRYPRLEQMQRTWYLFRRNTLALVGFAILLCIGLVAVYSVSLPLNWYQLPDYCATNYGPGNVGPLGSGYPGPYNVSHMPSCTLIVCTYETVPPPNPQVACHGRWYKTPYFASTDVAYASYVSPTASFSSPGTMPLGSLSLSGSATGDFYNIYTGLLRGSDWSLIFSLSIVGLGALLGLLVGASAGFLGGWTDDVLMRIVDIFLSIPTILFVVVVVAVGTSAVTNVANLGASGTKLLMLVVGFAIVWWPVYARIVRGQVLVTREQKYVEAARASGASKSRILFRHIIPNSVYPIFIQFSLDVGTIPLLIGSLSYLGFSKVFFGQPNFPEWGSIAALSVTNIQDVLGTCFDASGCVLPWWQFLFPGLALFLFAISVNLLSDGLRDALDPRLRR